MKFLSATRLGLTGPEHDALVAMMNHFRTPAAPPRMPKEQWELFAAKVDNFEEGGTSARIAFAMNFQAHRLDVEEFECGAVACIGGHVSLILQGVNVLANEIVVLTPEQAKVARWYVGDADENDPRQCLYYPPEEHVIYGRWAEITPLTASYAIENFLTKHDADWRNALKRGGQDHLATPLDV